MKLSTFLSSVDETNWKQVLNTPVNERSGYVLDSEKLIIPQVVCQFLGFSGDEDDYFNELFDLSQEPSICVLSNNINKQIEPEKFKAIQEILELQRKEKLSLNRLMAFLGGKKLIPSFNQQEKNRFVHQLFVSILKDFESEHSGGFGHPDFRRIFIDLIKFSKNHFEEWFKEEDVSTYPKIIWYGEATKSQQYFLSFLISSGFDVILFQPEGKDNFQFFSEKISFFKQKYQNSCSLIPFPTERRQRKATVAYNASKELEQVLHHENSFFYKPWQLRDYTPSHLTLKTTYEELFMLIKEEAYIRPGFEVTNGEVHIPSIFAKISGVSSNKRLYWSQLQELTDHPMSLTVRQFPMKEEISPKTFFYHYKQSLVNGVLDGQKMMDSNWWRYKHLPLSLQKGIATAISRYCDKPELLSISNEKEEDVKLYLFAQASVIPNEVLQLLQRFDYSKQVPKLILYNNELNGVFSRSDAALLLLLNELGVDLVLYNPPAHSDLELYIQNSLYDTHLLDEVTFEQEFQEPTFLSRFLRKIKF